MTAIPVQASHIRKVNVSEDLLAIADLIEICFSSTLDDDGREYLRHLRWAARDMNYLRWLQGAAERIASPLYGFVWVEDNRIVGNLSLIPVSRRGQATFLIANVATHPEYRGRGIGHQLTQIALDNLRERGIKTAWLQVRDDNPTAQRLYRSLGFVERARRTTWMCQPTPAYPVPAPDGIVVTRRRQQDWEMQRAWLREIYPPDVYWNLPLSLKRLDPSPLQQVMRWLKAEPQQNWQACKGAQPVGFLSWEPMRSSSDALWLGTLPEYENLAVQTLLPHARAALASRGRPLSVNYPAGRAVESFTRAGFFSHQTLIWMTVALTK